MCIFDNYDSAFVWLTPHSQPLQNGEGGDPENNLVFAPSLLKERGLGVREFNFLIDYHLLLLL